MSSTLFFIIFSALIVLYTLIGLYASQNLHTKTDYFLAGRQLGLWPLIFTLLATQIGGGMLLGTTEEAYKSGLHGFAYTLGMCIGFIILACGLAKRMQSMNIGTTAEIFEKKYGSPFLKKIASLLSTATMSGILIGQIIGSKKLLLSLGFFNEPMFIGFWFFTIWYTMAGGLHAVVLTDCFQILFIITYFFSIFGYIIYTPPTALTPVSNNAHSFTSGGDFNIHVLVATFLMPVLFSLIEQDLAQRFFAARTARIAQMAAIGSAFGLLVFAAIPVFFGIHARIIGLSVAENVSPLMPYISFFTSDIAAIFAACAIIAAITSTADSLLCAISSNIGQDFEIQLGTFSQITNARLITACIGLTTLVISYFIPQNVIATLIASYELSVSCLFVPLMVAYFSHRTPTYAAYGSIIGGLAGFIAFRLIPVPVPKEIATLFVSLTGFILGTFLTTERKEYVK